LKQEDWQVQASLDNLARPYLKIKFKKVAEGVGDLAQWLNQALAQSPGSNPQYSKK
jgi:hypothetical protein